MIHAKFQPNMPSCSGGKVDFIGSAIFSTGDHHGLDSRPGPEVIKLISCSTQLSMNFSRS